MPLEIECKVFIDNLQQFQQRLKYTGATLTKARVYEHNIRLSSDHHDFIRDMVVLRLRRDDRVRLTYKQPAPYSTHGEKARLELETEVQDMDTMLEIFAHLGFQPYMVYEKYRTTYHYDDIDDTELVVDEMPFGSFIEVEGENITQVLERLELADAYQIVVSYAQLFEQVKARHQLTFSDLTFDNFAGIVVDTTIFKSEQ